MGRIEEGIGWIEEGKEGKEMKETGPAVGRRNRRDRERGKGKGERTKELVAGPPGHRETGNGD